MRIKAPESLRAKKHGFFPLSDVSKAVMPMSQLFAGSDQPARRSFDIADVTIDGNRVPVKTRDVVRTPFCALTEFARSEATAVRDVLVVPPLSGHFPILLRDLVIGLITSFRLYVTDWINVRHVAVEHGDFGLEANISCVLEMIRSLGPGLTVIGLCQGGVSALAATALLAAADDRRTPAALILIAAPIDPLANPTRVVRLLRSRSLSWFEHNLITTVPETYAGRGRRVYPAHLQLGALWTYLARRVSEGSDICAKLLNDDGIDPRRYPFLDLYTSIMDLDAMYFLENTKSVYQDCALREGTFCCHGEPVDPRAIRKSALLTVEGEWDDIAAPGQTSAAHGLCTSLSQDMHRQIIVSGSGHFSLFHGETWRREVLPAIREFSGVGQFESKVRDVPSLRSR
jgi:poly(3-hydroxybutyrate) depolymerase